MIEIRDLLIAVSLLVSSLSLALHWYRGRKLIVWEWGSAYIDRKNIGGSKMTPNRKVASSFKIPMHVNNETRHSLVVTGLAVSYFDTTLPRHEPHRIGPGERATVEFHMTPHWPELALRFGLSGQSSETSSSNAETLKDISIALSLSIESKAFWRPKYTITKKAVLPAKAVARAINNQ